MSTEIGERRNHNVIGDVRYMKKEDIRRRLQQLNSICQEYNLKNLSERIDSQLKLIDEPLRIMIVGEGKSGKSSLLNALVGATVAEVDYEPKTWCIGVYESTKGEPYAEVVYQDSIVRTTVDEAKKLMEEYEKVSRSNKIILDYYVPLHQFDAYFSKYKLKLLGEITKESNVCVYIGKPYGAQAFGEVFYIRNMVYCLNLLFSYYSRNIPIKVEIYEPPLGYQNPFEELYIGIREWANNKNWDITLRASLTRIKRRKEQLNQLLEKHRIFNQFLDESKNSVKNKRGIWTIV